MLSDQEINDLARAHVRGHDVSRAGGRVLEAVKLCVLEDPPGIYYTIRFVEPADGLLLGGGGFFVDRSEGVIREFGSGEVFEACRVLDPERAYALEITPAVARFLLKHVAEPSFARHPREWWQFWK